MVFASDCLAGRVALVTGAAGGIGQSVVKAFRSAGCTIIATDLKEPNCEEGVLALAHDVTAAEAWADVVVRAAESFGRLDILVNCAGIFLPCAIADETPEGFLRTTLVNQLGVLLGMQAVLEPMKASGGGSIVNLSSGAGMGGHRMTVSYSASKFAVRGMTKVAAIEFAPFGIRVNSIHPAAVRTPMVTGQVDMSRGGENTLLKRIMEPEEVANMALFLASDASSYSTGSEFICDGGMRA